MAQPSQKLRWCLWLYTVDLILSIVALGGIIFLIVQAVSEIVVLVQNVLLEDEWFWRASNVRRNFVEFRLEGHKFNFSKEQNNVQLVSNSVGMFQTISLNILLMSTLLVINAKHAYLVGRHVYNLIKDNLQRDNDKSLVPDLHRVGPRDMRYTSFLSFLFTIVYGLSICVAENCLSNLPAFIISIILLSISFYHLIVLVAAHSILKDKADASTIEDENAEVEHL